MRRAKRARSAAREDPATNMGLMEGRTAGPAPRLAPIARPLHTPRLMADTARGKLLPLSGRRKEVHQEETRQKGTPLEDVSDTAAIGKDSPTRTSAEERAHAYIAVHGAEADCPR